MEKLFLNTKAQAGLDKDRTRLKTKKLILQLDLILQKLNQQKKKSVLVILQGMDASGKDGTVKNVFSTLNPYIFSVTSFKKPSSAEQDHDFLWRVHLHAPALGMIQVFNRSHYEDILIPEVHDLLKKDTLKRRYDFVNAFERMLEDQGTLIFKFFLNISRAEQTERFKERLSNPEKRWKYDPQDLQEAKLWNRYMDTYYTIFKKCNAPEWILVPADNKWYRDYVIAKTLVESLKECV